MIQLPYGNGIRAFDAEGAEVLTAAVGSLDLPCGRETVARAMETPFGSAKLSELAQGSRTCTLIVSDHTRPVPSRDILPAMLSALRAGNPGIEITLLAATGCHRGTTREELRAKLGDEIFQNERIVVHDCDDERANVCIGTLPSGAELVLDRLAVETDLLAAEGFIEPHFFAGFSGGRKSVLPGVCARKTVLGNHCSTFIDSPYARTGVLDNNPIHRDMLFAAKAAKLRFIVNVVLDGAHRTVAAFAGDPDRAHAAGCAYLAARCRVTGRAADIVITTNGGAPLDQNIYQCVKGMTAAEAVCRDGGVIILAAECADGVGGDAFFAQLSGCKSAAALYDACLQTPQDATAPDQWQSQILARVLMHHTVIMVTRAELRNTVLAMKMQYAASVDEALRTARAITGEKSTVTVIPDGVSVIAEREE